MIYGISLIILGLLAAPSLLANKPESKEILDKIAPYQGWIGLVFCIWGIFGVVNAILHLGVLGYAPIWWITWVGASALEAALGFILGYKVINELILSNSDEAKEKGKQVLAKLTPIQGKLGVAGIILGFWVIIANLMYM